MTAYKLVPSILTCLIVLLPAGAHAARLYIDPAEGSYGPGDTFIAAIRLDNEGECVNAAEVKLTYPTQSLRAVDFSRGDSIFSLWVEEPVIHTEKGTVSFAGGVPGGYCGRIDGDPRLSNIVGEVVFSVLRTAEAKADVSIDPGSSVFLNDGIATKAVLAVSGASITLLKDAVEENNPWLSEIAQDTLPPEEFQVYVEADGGVFGGKYFIAFSTVDKQSGIDHYEIFERGVWKRVSSPYRLKDQYLRGVSELKAIDKAGNERKGAFVESSTTPRVSTRVTDYALLFVVVGLVLLVGLFVLRRDRKKESDGAMPSGS